MTGDPATGQAGAVAFLTQQAGDAPVQTHISWLFLGHDTAWKLKKAVRLPFLDFTSLEARHYFCDRELALNAPAAPGLYRDVAPIVRRGDGSLGFGGAGDIVDWVVRMARVQPGDFLDVMAAAEGLAPEPVKEFHREGALMARFFFVTDPDGYRIEVLEQHGRYR